MEYIATKKNQEQTNKQQTKKKIRKLSNFSLESQFFFIFIFLLDINLFKHKFRKIFRQKWNTHTYTTNQQRKAREKHCFIKIPMNIEVLFIVWVFESRNGNMNTERTHTHRENGYGLHQYSIPMYLISQ